MKPAELERVAAGFTPSEEAGIAPLVKSSKKSRSRKAKSSGQASRITAIKTNKSEAARYRKANNPDFKVRIVRHGSKPADYYIDVKHTSKERVEVTKRDPHWGLMIAKTKKLKAGESRLVDLPFDNVHIESFIKQAEKNPGAINALKEPNEFFSFTVEGNKIEHTFRNIADLNNMLNYYLKMGSASARISLWSIQHSDDWTEKNRSIPAIKRSRQRKHDKNYNRKAYELTTEKEQTRMRRFRERLKTNEAAYAAYKAKDNIRSKAARARGKATEKKLESKRAERRVARAAKSNAKIQAKIRVRALRGG